MLDVVIQLDRRDDIASVGLSMKQASRIAPMPYSETPEPNGNGRVWRFLALGGGVQSSVMALMADHGEFGHPPDAAIHADTQWDPPETMGMVQWLADTLSYPVHVVTAGDLRDNVRRGLNTTSHRYVSLPTFTVHMKTGERGMSRRQCTSEYKLKPQIRLTREIMGFQPGQRIPPDVRAERWLGISWDEIGRMTDQDFPWEVKRYPLIERRLTRRDCEAWWRRNAPSDAPDLFRSSCIGCPYHSRRTWIELADRHPDMMAEAVELDQAMRNNRDPDDPYEPYLHVRRIPLAEAITADREALRWEDAQGRIFGEDEFDVCGGLCDT